MQRTAIIVLAAILTVFGLSACGSVITDIAPTHVASLTPTDSNASSATGTVRGRLAGADLILEGDYKDLSETVVSVQLERPDGTAIYSLPASGGTTGTFGSTQALPADDRTALNNGQLEIVVYTGGYPVGSEGELRGTLVGR